jgi:hypothetical protein
MFKDCEDNLYNFNTINWCEDELGIFTIKILKNTKMHEIGPYENIDISTFINTFI